MKSVGVGDVVSFALAKVGVTKERFSALKSILGSTSDCGCDGRQVAMNRLKIPVPNAIYDSVENHAKGEAYVEYMTAWTAEIVKPVNPHADAGPCEIADIEEAIIAVNTYRRCNPARTRSLEAAQWMAVNGIPVEMIRD